MSKQDKSLKTKIANALARLTDYLYINYLLAWLKYHKQPDAVFIWIPKTAGTSMFSRLQAPKLKKVRYIKYRFLQKGIVTFSHINYNDLVKNGYITPKFDQSAYKFTFVRNPYDRAVSLYHYLLTKDRFNENTGFLEFCRIIDSKPIEPVSLYNVRGLSQCNPQVKWLENINIDFIGKFENLHEDFRKLAQRLNLKDSELPHLRSTKHKHYSEYYCKESAEIIRRFYQEDFSAFDYDPDEIRFRE